MPLFKIRDGYASSLYSEPFRKSAVLDSILGKNSLPVFVDRFPASLAYINRFDDNPPHGPTLEISPSWNHGFFWGGTVANSAVHPPFAE